MRTRRFPPPGDNGAGALIWNGVPSERSKISAAGTYNWKLIDRANRAFVFGSKLTRKNPRQPLPNPLPPRSRLLGTGLDKPARIAPTGRASTRA